MAKISRSYVTVTSGYTFSSTAAVIRLVGELVLRKIVAIVNDVGSFYERVEDL
jgi:hypothetical protein